MTDPHRSNPDYLYLAVDTTPFALPVCTADSLSKLARTLHVSTNKIRYAIKYDRPIRTKTGYTVRIVRLSNTDTT